MYVRVCACFSVSLSLANNSWSHTFPSASTIMVLQTEKSCSGCVYELPSNYASVITKGSSSGQIMRREHSGEGVDSHALNYM